MGRPDDLHRGLQAGLARLPVLLLGLQAGINLIWAVSPKFRAVPWPSIFPLVAAFPGSLPALALGLTLLGLVFGLARRKRYAWAAGLALYAAAGAWALAASSILAAAIAIILAAWLLLLGKTFSARSDAAAVRRGWLVWGCTWLAVVLVGAVGWMVDRIAITIFIYALLGFGWLCLWHGYEQPLPAPPSASNAERDRARSIVQQQGRTSMAHLTLLKDKSYFFTPGGSLVAYAVTGRSALALGDPVGPPADRLKTIEAFREFCVRHDWFPAFCLTAPDSLDHYRSAGFGTLCLGHEGIIDLASFDLRGNARKTLRKRYNRLSAQGYRVQICEPPVAGSILAELRRISDEWLSMAGAAEKRFFLARFDEEYLRGECLALVYAPDGSICAFTSLTPEYQLNEISIDLMRRKRSIESGVMDFLFVSLFFWACRAGYNTFNLGLSPLFGVGDRPGRSVLESFINIAYRHGSFYDFKGLNGFKIKFHPAWVPQYMIYPGPLALVWVGLAMARLNAGENETLWQYFSRRPGHVPDEPFEAYLAGRD